jgi:NOL1/NOP2/fmu family ribosome biogenesis protein
MADAPFYQPDILEQEWDLATSQTGSAAQVMPFAIGGGETAKAGAKVAFSHNDHFIRQYEVGDGIVLSDGDTLVSVLLDGQHFAKYAGHKILAECSFINPGNVEIKFHINIIKTFIQ